MSSSDVGPEFVKKLSLLRFDLLLDNRAGGLTVAALLRKRPRCRPATASGLPRHSPALLQQLAQTATPALSRGRSNAAQPARTVPTLRIAVWRQMLGWHS